MNDAKCVELEAILCYQWGFGQYLSSFQKLVTVLEGKGYLVKYDAFKGDGGKQEVYLLNGGKKTLVYSKLETGKFLDDINSKNVTDKIIGLL